MDLNIHLMDNIARRARVCPCRRTFCSQCRQHEKTLSDKWYKKEIIRFLKRHPYANQRQLLDLARELRLTKEELDSKVISLLQSVSSLLEHKR